MERAGEFARLEPSAIEPAQVRDGLKLLTDLPHLMLPPDEQSAVAQQVSRMLLSYQGWRLPQAVRSDQPGGDALWSLGLPHPGSAPGGAQLLPLCCDDTSLDALIARGVREGESASVVRTVITGATAVAQHLPLNGQGRHEGLWLNPGEEHEFIYGKDLLPQLHAWEGTLRLEKLLASELAESATGDGQLRIQQPEASDELAMLLAKRAKLCFVRMGDNLAYDGAGQNFVTLTSNDAAALCANAYGKQMVRAITTQEILEMAEMLGYSGGYSLTVGPDRASYKPSADDKHIPMWYTRVVSADWMVTTLRKAASLPAASA